VRKIKAVLNPKLSLIGLLPTMVEPTPFQRANFIQVIERHHALMIKIGDGAAAIASIPKRSCIAEAQAAGEVLWEVRRLQPVMPGGDRAEPDQDRPARHRTSLHNRTSAGRCRCSLTTSRRSMRLCRRRARL
jgi:hypothetical protein